MHLHSRSLQFVRGIGLVEGISFLLLLLVAMPLKYAAGYPQAVSAVGMGHGLLFIAYVAALAYAWAMAGLPTRWAWYGVLAAVLPAGPFIYDAKLKKRFANPQDDACASDPTSTDEP
ncbi:MAG: DUF3817 domain-containing protein [Planctomycetota bacterium]